MRELGQLLEAGFDPARALATVADARSGVLAQRWGRVRRAVEAGQSLAQALAQQGLVDRSERALLAALDRTGRVDAGLAAIADEAERAAARRRRIRSGLTLPVAVLVLAAFVAPLPALFAGDVTAGGYVLAVLRPVVIALALVWLGFRYGLAVCWTLADLAFRLRGRPSLRQRRNLCARLGRLLDAGIDGATAMDTLADDERGLRATRLERAGEAAARGDELIPELARQGLIDRRLDGAVLKAGEGAGRLPDLLQHRAGQLDAALARRDGLVADWLPRLAYALVVGYLVSQLL